MRAAFTGNMAEEVFNDVIVDRRFVLLLFFKYRFRQSPFFNNKLFFKFCNKNERKCRHGKFGAHLSARPVWWIAGVEMSLKCLWKVHTHTHSPNDLTSLVEISADREAQTWGSVSEYQHLIAACTLKSGLVLGSNPAAKEIQTSRHVKTNEITTSIYTLVWKIY